MLFQGVFPVLYVFDSLGCGVGHVFEHLGCSIGRVIVVSLYLSMLGAWSVNATSDFVLPMS